MKPSFPLRWRILCHVVLNVLMVIGVMLALLYFEFQAGPDSLLLAPTDTRLRALTERLTTALGEGPASERDQILRQVGGEYGVELGLYIESGEYVAGALTNLPSEVREWFRPRRMREDKQKGSRPLFSMTTPKKKGGKKKGPVHEIHMHADSSGYWFVSRLPITALDTPDMPFGTLIIRTPSILFNPQLFDLRPWVFSIVLLGTVTFTCWAPFIRGLTRSVQEMKAGAEMISCGHFDVQLPASRTDEIGQLCEALNRMANQLNGFVYGQKRFLGDIAHELSAPIARVQANMGILEERVPKPLGNYVDGVASEVNHMSHLVDDLLQFSRASLAADAPKLETVNIADLATQVKEREATGGADVRLVEGGELNVRANSQGLFRALSNIVRNALRYAGQDGPVLIGARIEDGHVLLAVSDHGPGIPEDALDRVFAPFYRVEISRSRLSGGVGLGMAIVRSCVESSGGTVWCTNRQPRGLEVTIRLPEASAEIPASASPHALA
ncbi:MAG: HAMP domain-containing histidine kinase [Acidobacteria bacterium]|nr:HAMP domain-containing histidine kinase [Acidobacteriota bacterium]